MQKELKIKTPDKKVIYGTLDTPSKPAKSLVILVHGLGAHQNEHIFFNGAKYFKAKNVASFRFNFYSGGKDGRILRQTTIAMQTEDVNTIVNYFKTKYKNIFLVGHSLGGLSILKANLKSVKGLILWDSTHTLRHLDPGDRFDKNLDAYIIDWGVEILMGKEMIEEWLHFPPPKELAKGISIPMKVICAGKGDRLVKMGKEYYQYAAGPKELAVIKGATHNFDEEGTEDQLFKETYTWVKKFS